MHPLEQQVEAARRRIRQLLVLYGVGRVVAFGLGAIVLLALADFLIRSDDPGVRWICSLVFASITVWAIWRYLVPALRQPLGEVLVAGRIERRFPRLGDHLSSTIEFLHEREDDPLAGSAELRRAAVAQAAAEIGPLDWRAAINSGPVVRAIFAACGIVAIAVVLLIARPLDARIALVRLIDPLSSIEWPPTNNLVFVHRVDRVAFGEPFEVELKDRSGKLPDEVKIQYRTVVASDADPADRESKIETQSMQRIGDLMVARKDHVDRAFDYRAEGGDDRHMPWIHVEVVEPPRIESLSITLHPPEYTGWPVQPSQRRIVALRGTAVEFIGRANKPIAAAVLHAPGNEQFIADLSADGRGFSIPTTPNPSGQVLPVRNSVAPKAPSQQAHARPFVVDHSGVYWFELRDREGMSSGGEDRWDIQAIADEPPTVSLVEPTANMLATPQAAVDISVAAKDDLALHTVGLLYTRSDRTDLGEIAMSPLYSGPEHLSRAAAPVTPGMSPADSRKLDFAWQLAPMNLKPGTNVSLTVEATDYAGQRTVSSPRRISVVTPDEFQTHLASRESAILSELDRLLKLEQGSRQKTAALETQVDRVGRLTNIDLDQLRADDLDQRQIRRGLVGSNEGVRQSVVGLLHELANNHLDNPEMHRRMQAIADGLARLDQNELPAAEQSLTESVKAAEDTPRGAAIPPAGRHSLADAGRLQESIATTLESLLGDLAEWNSFNAVARQLAEIRRDHSDIEQATRVMSAATLTSDIQDLDPQQQADLKKLSDRQTDLVRQLDKLVSRMGQVARQIAQSEPLSAQSLTDALDVARQKSPGGQMLGAADNVAQNHLGKALGQQATAGSALDEMLDILSNHRDQDLSRLVMKLRDAEHELAALRTEQDQIQKRLAELAAAAAKSATQSAARDAELQRLSRQQHDLAQRTDRLQRELQRLQAQQAANSMQQATSAMQQASQSAQNKDANQANQNAQSAQRNLDEAQRQLAEARRQAEADLAQQQLGRLEDSIKGLVDLQQRSIDETIRLERLRATQGDLSRGQVQSVLDLSRQQQSLASDTDGLAGKLVGIETFQFVLEQASRGMVRTAARLSQRDTGSATQQLEQDVLRRLTDLLAAMKQDQPPKPPQPNNKNGQPGNGGAKKPPDNHALAELRLIHLMQDDLNRRTRRLDEAVAGSATISDEQKQEFTELTEEQGHLAELMVKLTGEGKSSDSKDANP